MSKHIAVLGGGLTGLSSAFHLARRFPTSRITLIERQKELGGWVRSKRVGLGGKNGTVLLEAGPRTLRPNAASVLELINLLGLGERVITVPKNSPAAQSRYLYIPPSYGTSLSGLQRIPTSPWSLLKSPLTRILVPAVLQEFLKPNNRPLGIEDESVDAFLRRRFGGEFAQIFGSAIIHGIYAADSRQVGIRSAFPTMWDAAERGWGSLIRGSLLSSKQRTLQDYETGDIPKLMDGASVYSFRNGLQDLTNAMEDYLLNQSRVEILRDSAVTSISATEGRVQVSLANGVSMTPWHVISTLPTHHLHRILSSSLGESKPLEYLLANPTSSVHVVNIVFPGPPSTIHPAGFGYLIPRPPLGYPLNPDQGPCILGTVFDSCSLSAQDAASSGKFGYDAQSTKLTVMVGGPYPLPQLPQQLSSSESGAQLPEYMQKLLGELSTHLARPLPPPAYWRIEHNKDCIPTLRPGHLERMAELQAFLSVRFNGRFQAVGAGIGGVSVGDCVEGGKRAALRVPLE